MEIKVFKNKQLKTNYLREQDLKRIEMEKEIIKPVDFTDFNESFDESNEKFKNIRSNVNLGLKNSYFKQLDSKELPNSVIETNKLPLDIIDIVNKLVDVKLKILLKQDKENIGNVLGNKKIKDSNNFNDIKNLYNPNFKSPLIKQFQKEPI